MQRVVASLAVLVVAWLCVSVALPAQEATGAVAGRLVDAAGQALGGVTVELSPAEGGQSVSSPVQVGVTDAQGAWAFSGVAPGEYVVQAVMDTSVVGVPVTVDATLLSGVVIVGPSAAAAGAVAASAAGLAVAGIGGAAAVVGTLLVRDDQS